MSDLLQAGPQTQLGTEKLKGVAPLRVLPAVSPEMARILTPDALTFVAELETLFGPRRFELLAERKRAALREPLFAFREDTRLIREDQTWRVAPCPTELEDRRVEITGPAEPKMMINALNSGARVFMVDLEDALSPTFENVVRGIAAITQATRKTLTYVSPDGKTYRLGAKTATLIVRPRGWHLQESHAVPVGTRTGVSGSLFDFGLTLFHSRHPYYYLPKMESAEEAVLWADVFRYSEDRLKIPRGTIRATMLIETLPAAFQMEEMLYALRDYASGLNAGRWDYIFSAIKKQANDPDFVLPDRAQITMATPFMRAYAELLVRTCHRRGAHAMGGMSAFVPSRKDPEVTARALAKVREDKEREASQGFDGTWVAHPDLVAVAEEAFDNRLGAEPHQKHLHADESAAGPESETATTRALLSPEVAGGMITERGARTNIEVTLRYVERWLSGQGAVAIHNLMEDAATAEISRAQLWQWLHHRAVVTLVDGTAVPFSRDLYLNWKTEEVSRLKTEWSAGATPVSGLETAEELLDRLVLDFEFKDFLTLEAYPHIVTQNPEEHFEKSTEEKEPH